MKGREREQEKEQQKEQQKEEEMPSTGNKMQDFKLAILRFNSLIDTTVIVLNMYLRDILNSDILIRKEDSFNSAQLIYSNLFKKIDSMIEGIRSGKELSIEAIKEQFKSLKEEPHLFVDPDILSEVKTSKRHSLAAFVNEGLVKKEFYQPPHYPIYRQTLIAAMLDVYEELVVLMRLLKMINYESIASKLKQHLSRNLSSVLDKVDAIGDISSWFNTDDIALELDPHTFTSVMKAAISPASFQKSNPSSLTQDIDSLLQMLNLLYDKNSGLLIDIIREAKIHIENNDVKLRDLHSSYFIHTTITETVNKFSLNNSLLHAVAEVKAQCQYEENKNLFWDLAKLKKQLEVSDEEIYTGIRIIDRLLQDINIFDKVTQDIVFHLNESSKFLRSIINFIHSGEHQHSTSLVSVFDELISMPEVVTLKEKLIKAKEVYYASSVEEASHKQNDRKSISRKDRFYAALSFWKEIDSNATVMPNSSSQVLPETSRVNKGYYSKG